jgi:hypothetical protein
MITRLILNLKTCEFHLQAADLDLSFVALSFSQICNSMESANIRMVKLLDFMERMRLWINNPAQSRFHKFQEMTLNFALICKSIRDFMIDSTHNIPAMIPWHQNVSEKASGNCNASNESFKSLIT